MTIRTIGHYMKRLLVVSDPPVRPGYLPRLRYLCDYLVQKGYDVTLLTEESDELLFAHSYPIETIRMYSGSTFDWFVKSVWTLISDWHNRSFARQWLSKSRNSHFDAVVCTTFSDFPLGAALRIAKHLRVPFICDIRDLDEQVEDSHYQYHHQTWWTMPFRHLYRSVHIHRRNCVLRQADAITTVSPWHADFIQQFNPNIHVVYNGYDERQFYPEDIVADHFTISYIGSLYEWQKPALQQVHRAIKELQLPITLQLHTRDNAPIAFDQLGNAIRRSCIMLVLTSQHTHGMMTTKFYEALGCEKPILCVPSDLGCLAQTIQYTNAGIATSEIDEIKAFILDKYHEWQTCGFTRQKVQNKELFSRKTQSEQIAQLL